jgi:hypothetical protein
VQELENALVELEIEGEKQRKAKEADTKHDAGTGEANGVTAAGEDGGSQAKEETHQESQHNVHKANEESSGGKRDKEGEPSEDVANGEAENVLVKSQEANGSVVDGEGGDVGPMEEENERKKENTEENEPKNNKRKANGAEPTQANGEKVKKKARNGGKDDDRDYSEEEEEKEEEDDDDDDDDDEDDGEDDEDENSSKKRRSRRLRDNKKGKVEKRAKGNRTLLRKAEERSESESEDDKDKQTKKKKGGKRKREENPSYQYLASLHIALLKSVAPRGSSLLTYACPHEFFVIFFIHFVKYQNIMN